MDDPTLPPLPAYTLRPLPPLVPGIPDAYLALALPVLAYWAVSMFFHVIDTLDLFPQYRLHTPAEVLKRNRVSRYEVFRDVVLQQVIQTAVGLVLTWIDPDPMCGKDAYDVAVWAQRIRLAQRAIPVALAAVGVDAPGLARSVGSGHGTLAGLLAGGAYPRPAAFAPWEMAVARLIHHALLPAAQFFFAICVLDTWQYFLHRAMHLNRYLYTTFHSRHHRLYVPYAYGALYNHPFEGFLLDTLGTGVGYLLSGMTVRQSMWFFTFCTVKTVDDHCGYQFPWDPLQHITSNNAGYHDVHHQSWGIKTNFSQPFFTFWDGVLGTKWTGGDVSARYARARSAAERGTETGGTAQESQGQAAAPRSPSASAPAKASSTARPPPPPPTPRIPAGKAQFQALASRQQVLEDRQGGGAAVLAEEAAEEARAQILLKQQQQQQQQQQQSLRRSPRKRTASSGLKGLADRVGESLHGKSSGVLGVESGRR